MNTLSDGMRLFDVHCHLQAHGLLPVIDAVVGRAAAAGLAGLACCACAEDEWPLVADIARRYPLVTPAFGLHPARISARSPDWRRKLVRFLEDHPAAGIGEAGLDRAASSRDAAEQDGLFREQMELADGMRRPLTIHCRGAWGRLLELLRRAGLPSGGAMVHAYSGAPEIMRELLDMGCYISFAGGITRPRHARARRAVGLVPAERLLLETDAPDMPPLGCRAPNEPARLVDVLAAAAELRAVPAATLAAGVYANSRRFFGLDDAGKGEG